MKKILVLAGCLMVMGASLASAVTGPGIIDLAWNACYGPGNVDNPCNSNTGNLGSLYASCDPGEELPEFLGMTARVDFTSSSASVPDYWKHGTGACRVGPVPATARNMSSEFNLPTDCDIDTWAGAASGDYLYEAPSPDGMPNQARCFVTCAVGTPFATAGGLGRWYMFDLKITNQRTTGSGSCAGCAIPGCLVLRWIQLAQTATQQYDPFAETPGTSGADAEFNAGLVGGDIPDCPQSTPAKNSTWGQVKKLYR